MFFSVKCPVSEEEKEWIEKSMLRLVKQFGSRALCEARVVLPSSEYFPDPFLGTRDCARAVADRVCKYMGVNPDQVGLDFYSERHLVYIDIGYSPLGGVSRAYEGASGLYIDPENTEKAIIVLESSGLSDFLGLTAMIARLLGKMLLIRVKEPPSEEERGPLADLVTVFLGLGVLTANTAFRYSARQDFDGYRWTASRQGHLSEFMYGYALASFAWMRDEQKPRWAKSLTLNVRTFLKQSLRYLQKTEDTLLPIYG